MSGSVLHLRRYLAKRAVDGGRPNTRRSGIGSGRRSREFSRMLAGPAAVRSSAFALLLACTGCNYLALLRPSVLRLLNPRMVALVNELPNVDHQNKEIIGQLFAQGGLGHAVDGQDGVMHITIHIPDGHLLWEPAVIVMPHIGKLQLEFHNNDQYFHLPYLPSNGDRQLLELPTHTAGRVTIELDEPGFYTFQDAVANFAGRGMLGAILVAGEVPSAAKMDRPPQRRPGK